MWLNSPHTLHTRPDCPHLRSGRGVHWVNARTSIESISTSFLRRQTPFWHRLRTHVTKIGQVCEPAYRIALTHCARRGTDRNRRFLIVAKNRHMAYSHCVCSFSCISGSAASRRAVFANRCRRPDPEPMPSACVRNCRAVIGSFSHRCKKLAHGLFARRPHFSVHFGLSSI